MVPLMYTATNPPRLNGIGFFLALNALNFAEADRPFNRLSEQRLAEMYFAIGIQCYYSFSYGSTIPMVRKQSPIIAENFPS